MQLVTLCEESVDWNMFLLPPVFQSPVTLCEESVDWNLCCCLSYFFRCRSLSARRVWIEIGHRISRKWWRNVTLCEESVDWNIITFVNISAVCGHSLRGECGLKSEVSPGGDRFHYVTLCEESVDWNIKRGINYEKGWKSLSARRVWIEIPEVRGFKHKFPDNSHVDICANLHNQGKNVYILLQSIPFNIKQYF